MSFRETNQDVISFYAEFHNIFSEIDQNFERLDGSSDSSIANKIVSDLKNYHTNCYKNCTLPSESNDFYDELQVRIEGAHGDFEEYADIVKKMQQHIHDCFAHRSQGVNDSCMRIISQILETLPQPLDQGTGYYATIRILRELVADCSISIRGLKPLAYWNYGTTAYSQLSEKEQLVLLVNQSILIDRMYFSLHLLENTLNYLNTVIDRFDELNWTVYYVAGFLNFKIHQYSFARKYFMKVRNQKELKASFEQSVRKRYFHSFLLIAYSYEYAHRFREAIETIAMGVESFHEILKDYSFDVIDINFKKIMESICELSKKNSYSLLSEYFSSFAQFMYNAYHPTKEIEMDLEMQFEILHALAHCLNEYSIQSRATTNSGKFIRLARCIMRTIADIKPEYWTCYATIHGEFQDYHQALIELDRAQEALIDKKIGKDAILAEISFFKYYFSLLINRNSAQYKKIFEEYCDKYDDDDAKCYLKIFEFRDKLRRYLSTLYNSVNQLVDDDGAPFTEENIPLIDDALQKKYVELCSMEPTPYMNANVRAEWLFMQRAYICIKCLRDYFILPTPDKLLILRNACHRFNVVRQELGLPSLNNHKTKQTIANFPEVVRNSFSTDKVSILNSLYGSDSIFILAPISGSVVYQYQTGNIAELFDDNLVTPALTEELECNIAEIATELFELYNQLPVIYGQPQMKDINWDKLRKYTDTIYYWSDTAPAQVCIAKEGGETFVRQIEDAGLFIKAMSDAKLALYSGHRKHCSGNYYRKNPNLRCTLQKYALPWLEIINENEEQKFFYIAWDDGIEIARDKIAKSCYIVPFTSENKHALHSLLRNISIEYSQFEYPDSNYIIEDTPEDIDRIDMLISSAKKIESLANAKKRTIELKRSKADKEYGSYKKYNPNAFAAKKERDKFDNMLSQIDEILKYISQYLPTPSQFDKSRLQDFETILNNIDES